MEYNKHKPRRHFIAALLIAITLSSAMYQPSFAPRAQAIFGLGDIVIDIKALARSLVDGIAMRTAQRMVDDIIKDTINWANTGFEGGPAYVTNTGRYFTNIADGVAGEFIRGSDLGALCSPFERTVRLSLSRQYYQPPETQFQCTLSGVGANLEAFYEGFDDGGGWDTWFAVSQNPTNNPYGAYVKAQGVLNAKIDKEILDKEGQLDRNTGYLSWKECLVYNPNQSTLDAIAKSLESDGPVNLGYPVDKYDLSKPAGACIKEGDTKTPGINIKEQLDNVLPSGVEKLITVNHVEQLIGAFANGLLNRYVFNRDRDKGLFDSQYSDHLRTPSDGPDIPKPGDCELTKTLPGGDTLDSNCQPLDDGSDDGDPGKDDVDKGTDPDGDDDRIDEGTEDDPTIE